MNTKNIPVTVISGFLGAGRIQRETVLSETSNPSIKSSPWMLALEHGELLQENQVFQ